MTDTMPEQSETDWSDVEQSADGATYPEAPQNPHNHRFTISMNGQGPMVVVRGNTAEEINAAWQELEEHATGAIMGSAWSSLKAAAMLANGLGASPAPAGPPAPPQMGAPQAPPFGPNVSVPQAPGYQGPPAPQVPQMPQAPAAGQWSGQAGGGRQNSRGPKERPAWPQVYKVNVPLNAKDQFRAFREQNKDYLKGKVAWAGGGDYWVHGDVVQSFAGFNPVPA
jgi:hypothetical protein